MKATLTTNVEYHIAKTGCFWFPDLTETLAELAWKRLKNEGISPTNYRTECLLEPERTLILSSASPVNSYFLAGPAEIRIEMLSEEITNRYEKAGISFYTSKDLADRGLVERIEDALEIINKVPEFYRTVVLLVKSIHLIRPSNDDFDVSFSEPEIPFSIFVSVPLKNGETTVLRLAEAIVHEAMHLQLTLIERSLPLALPGKKLFFSPWKGEYRSPQGVLHALYVFRVIYDFFALLKSCISPPLRRYAESRQKTILNEMRTIKPFETCPDLTSTGRLLARRLLIC